ncbi:MAG TPA: type II and III secretion system protein [Burkholderiaceae bacterium]|nr:type II and III secretion system protein [Burkholderiaceae bacterium]
MKRHRYRGGRRAGACALVLLTGCSGTPLRPADYHLTADRHVTAPLPRPADTGAADEIPPPVNGPLVPPRPKNAPKLETYSVVVSQVEIAELLFAMARDARINVDVHPDVRGKVTLNAINQTLPQILTRLARQVDLRYEFDGKNLVVMPDRPFVRHYTVDYVNIARESRANTSIATQIASTGRDPLTSASTGGTMMSNNSTTQISNVSINAFWGTLLANVRAILNENGVNGDGTQSGTTGANAATPPATGSAPPPPPAAAGTGGGPGSPGSPGGTAGGPGASGNAGGRPGNAAGAAGGAAAGNAAGGGAQGGGSAGSPAAAGQAPAREQPYVMASPETSLMTVKATSRQHEKVREYLDKVLYAARRQVMIEATIAEVELSDEFQQGINWSRMRLAGTGFAFSMQPQGTNTLAGGATPGSGPGGITFPATGGGNLPGGANVNPSGNQNQSLGVLRYLRTGSTYNLGAAVSLLQSFGKVKVLSSPKISVLNNQAAVLKVVDNKVYFTIGVQITPGSTTSAPVVTYTSTPNTVPVGFVMSVIPQIEESGIVAINVRPTISRIIGYVNDPNPALAQAGVVSRVPEIQTREMESILKVNTGDVAVMGGLMQQSVNDRHDFVPGAAGVPVVGEMFRYRNEASSKTELVVFLRPIVVRDASMEGDYRHLKSLQPADDFFATPKAPSVPRAWARDEDAKGDRTASTDAGRPAGEGKR